MYAVLIGLALWFVLWIWSFAGAGVTDYLPVIVSGFILVVVALTLILSRVGHKDPATDADEAKADDKPASFRDWAASDFDTYAGRQHLVDARRRGRCRARRMIILEIIFTNNPISVPTLIEEIQLVGVCGRNFLRCIVVKQAIDRGFLEQGETQNL